MTRFEDASDIIVDDDILTEEEFKFIDEKIISWNVPFYTQSATKNIIMLTHEFIGRTFKGEIWSEKYFRFFETIVERFCKKHSLSFETVYRACVNLGSENSKFKQSHPHVDFNFREVDNTKGLKNVLIYLNDVVDEPGYNSTILYKERGINLDQSKDVLDFSESENFAIEREVAPKKGRIVCFDGFRYHANYFSKGNEFRYVAVFNFS